MSNIVHFPNFSVVSGSVRININMERLEKNRETAQWWLGEQVLQGCRAFMPLLTGNLQQRSRVEDGGRRVVFPGPYARYLYMGRVMVDSATGKGPRKIPAGPDEYILRFRRGARLKPTSRRLTYSNPEAVDHWFDEAKARNLPHWLNGVENIIRTGQP